MKRSHIKFSTILLLFIVSLAAASCKKGCTDPTAMNYDPDAKKDDGSCMPHDHHEMASATIDVTSLNEGDTIQSGNMVMVHGTITGTAHLHGYDVEIKNVTADTVVHVLNNTDHAMSYNFNEHWMNNVTANSNMTATVIAYLNHEHTMSETKVINFVCLP